MAPRRRTGLLLINLGTPDSPAPADVRPYLREFLMDPRVLDIPTWRRWLVVNLFILPFRPKQSGEAYAKIWTDRGSPLLLHTEALADKMQRRLGADVEVIPAMRYGKPPIRSALERFRAAGIDDIAVFPLYPQYSSAANGSSLDKVFTEAAKLWNVPNLQVIPPFYDHPGYIDACARAARPILDEVDPEVVFFSFHGLPERHVKKSDDSGSYCLVRADCCERIVEENRNCYSAQCYATARALAERLGVPEDRRRVCYQSRLGRTPWLRPYTDELLIEEARKGRKRAVILSPAFVADCLETLEELGIRAAEDWKAHGGEKLTLVPAVNSNDDWADAAVRIVREHTRWLDAPDARRLEKHAG
ncbi:MAG: ferrochelatase [bacterium]|nr:ferrochelatase [bacterium]